MTNNNPKKLFEEFPPVSIEQWEEAIKTDLKGADYDKKLVWKTDEGIKVKPYYTSEDLKNLKHLKYNVGEFPYVRGAKIGHNNWEIQQDVNVYSIDEANKFALEALERGATSICFIANNKINSQADFSSLLKNIYFNCIDLSFQACQQASKIFDWLLEESKNNNIDLSNANGAINYNPLGVLTTFGNWILNEEKDFILAKEMIEKSRTLLPRYRILLSNGSVIREAGSSIIQEIAFSLAMGNEYLQRLTDLGLAVDDIAPRIQFNFTSGSNYFFEIAKIRAFRMLWAKVVEAYKPADISCAKAYVHCTTAYFNMSLYDPYVNILRNTTESMSVIIGGADSLSVRPHNLPFQKPNSFSYRIARNAQIILKEEAHFDKVSDPAAGSYYIESLTSSLANEAWKLFLQVEEMGGYSKAFKKGWIQESVNNMANKLYADVASRKYTLVGTNQYPNFNENVLSQIDNDIFSQPMPISENPIAQPLKKIRIGRQIEEIRLKTEKSNHRPKVFMLTIGNLAMRIARSQFSSNFFGVAGFEIIDNNGFETVEEGVEAAVKSGAEIVVLCSSDEEYATLAPEAFRLLNNRAIFVVAGNPPSMEQLQQAGINNFISIRSNILETLDYYQKLLNIK
jgi:methylmalonyl-CoA mutase